MDRPHPGGGHDPRPVAHGHATWRLCARSPSRRASPGPSDARDGEEERHFYGASEDVCEKDYVMSRRTVRTSPAVRGATTQSKVETMICGQCPPGSPSRNQLKVVVESIH